MMVNGKLFESNRQLQLRASRAYLGVPKQTPIPGIFSEMNWPEPRSRTQLQMVRHYHRMLKIYDNRLIKKIFYGTNTYMTWAEFPLGLLRLKIFLPETIWLTFTTRACFLYIILLKI